MPSRTNAAGAGVDAGGRRHRPPLSAILSLGFAAWQPGSLPQRAPNDLQPVSIRATPIPFFTRQRPSVPSVALGPGAAVHPSPASGEGEAKCKGFGDARTRNGPPALESAKDFLLRCDRRHIKIR